MEDEKKKRVRKTEGQSSRQVDFGKAMSITNVTTHTCHRLTDSQTHTPSSSPLFGRLSLDSVLFNIMCSVLLVYRASKPAAG